MKLIIILAFIILGGWGNHSLAQSAFSDQLTWGGSFEVGTYQTYPIYTEHTTNYTYLITTAPNKGGFGFGEQVSIYNSSSLSFRGQYDLKFVLEKKNLKRERQFVFANELYFITSRKDNKAKLKNFYLQKIDELGNISTPRLIASVNFGNARSATGRDKVYASTYAFKVVKSPDGKSLAFLFPSSLYGSQKSENQWNVVLYDDQLTILNKYEIIIPQERIQLGEIVLTNDRNIYALGLQDFIRLKTSLSKIPANMPQGHYPVGSNYYLYHFEPVKKILSSIDLSLSDKDVLNARIKVIEESIVFYGFTGYAKKKDVFTEGFFIKKMNLNGEILFSTVQNLDDDFYKYKSDQEVVLKGYSFRNKKKNFLLGEIFKTDKGNYVFLAEQYKFGVSNDGSGFKVAVAGSNPSLGLNNKFGDLVIFSCSNEGSLNWTKRFFKSEYHGREGDFLSSFFVKMKGNKLHILMNDEMYRTNEEMYDSGDIKDKKAAIKNKIVSEIIIDEKGNSERNLLFDIDDNANQESVIEANLKDKIIAPKSFYLREDGNFIFFSRFLIQKGIGIARQDISYIRIGRMELKK
ncbi:MAG: hypothetical protein HRT58_08080 [Crocinitomicaceae bacterium]|nr:hypothetical protein [Flavobacteriales bacterium]NQZ35608.1 hypothetical protein [Crocinitomicaceae bacterium]